MAINWGDYYDWAKDPKKELEKQLNKLMSDQPKQDDIDWGKIYDWAREPEPTPPPEPSTWEKIKSGVSGVFKDKTLKDEAEQAAERARERAEEERPKMLEKAAEGAKQLGKQLGRDLYAGVADFSKYTFYEPLKSIGVYKIPGVGSALEKLEEGVDQVRAGDGTEMDLQVIRSLTGAGTKMLEETAEEAAEGAKWLGKNLYAGVGDFSNSFYRTLQSVGLDKVPGINKFLDEGVKATEYAQSMGGTDIGSQVVRALPGAGVQAGLALMTGGASTAGQIPATGAEAVRQSATQMLKSPTFWSSAIRSYGSAYGEARDAGASRLEGISTGILQAIPQAMIEQAGGIEQLGKKAGEGVLRSIGRTALEEAGEEILQYPFEGLAKKATYAPETPWFSTKEQAVINPVQQAQAGLVGGLVGGIMGAGGKALNSALNRPDINVNTESDTATTTEPYTPPSDNVFYVDPYGNVATDSQYRPPLLLPPGPDFQAQPQAQPQVQPQADFYVDRYGNVRTDNAPEQLQLPE